MTNWTVGEVEINKVRDTAAISVILASDFMLKNVEIFYQGY